jgi:hypothetical protein
MFAYSPTPDRSGEIIAAGQIGAANAYANAYGNIGNQAFMYAMMRKA